MINEFERHYAHRIVNEMSRRKNAVSPVDSLYEYSRRAWNLVEPKRQFVPGWHIEAICEHLEAVKKGEIKNLLINMPPRHMKSLLVSVFFQTWVWVSEPWKRFLYSSYSQSLSTRDSVKCRRIIQSAWYHEEFKIPWTLSDDQNAKMRFSNSHEGYRLATSVGGAGTGEGGDYNIVDDPLKATEAYSQIERENVLVWWDEEMSSRANDPSNYAKIIVMQRLHEDDLSGHVLAQGGYEHLVLPAEYEGHKVQTSIGWEDPREEIGELLWPERFGPEQLSELKKRLGPGPAAGQLQQRPAPEGGMVVEDTWWKEYDPTHLPDFDAIIQSWDLSFDATDHSSFVVGQVWGRKGADKYLLDQQRKRAKFTEQLVMFETMCTRHPKAIKKLVEKKANGAALIDMLGRKIAGIIPVEVKGSKMARAEAVAPEIQSGNVFLPPERYCPWVKEFKHEWKIFPNGSNDDQVDATSQALNEMQRIRVHDVLPISITGTSKWIR